MRRGLEWITGGAAVAAAAGAMLTMGRARWQRATGEAVARMKAAAGRGTDASVEADRARVDLAGSRIEALPAPVQRYLRLVLRDRQPLARRTRIEWDGEFRLIEERRTDAAWRPFEATQVFTFPPPGFVWDARIRMAPLIDIRVRDSYVAGRGAMQGAAFGVVRIVDAGGARELDEGALQRLLGECVWLPAALLPGGALQWTAMDDTHARATLTDAGHSVSMEFEFAQTGEIVGAFTPHRYRSRGNEFVSTPFGGVYRRYEDRGGVLVPAEAEVYWMLQGKRVPYWRGQLRTIAFD